MYITCLTVGKRHDKHIDEAVSIYNNRLNKYTRFEFEFINISTIEQESVAIIRRLREDDQVILLDNDGDLIDNSALTGLIESSRIAAHKRIVFIIGGPFGVDKKVYERSNRLISFSSLIFPHQLMRLLLVEQLYRTYNTLAGGKYHHPK